MTADEAIEYIKSCRDSHIDTIYFYDEGYTAQDWSDDLEIAVGSKEFHQTCVDQYNEAIKALEEALK